MSKLEVGGTKSGRPDGSGYQSLLDIAFSDMASAIPGIPADTKTSSLPFAKVTPDIREELLNFLHHIESLKANFLENPNHWDREPLMRHLEESGYYCDSIIEKFEAVLTEAEILGLQRVVGDISVMVCVLDKANPVELCVGSSNHIEVIRELHTRVESLNFRSQSLSTQRQILFDMGYALEALDILQLDGEIDEEEGSLLVQSFSAHLKKCRAVYEGFFQKRRDLIASGKYTSKDFRADLESLMDSSLGDEIIFDDADVFVRELFALNSVPERSSKLAKYCREYEPTPIRLVLNGLSRIDLKEGDVFVDVGTGLGIIPITVGFYYGIRAIGIEIEESFVKAGSEVVSRMSLKDIEIRCEDANRASFSDGSVFFFFSPVEKNILENICRKLSTEAESRTIHILSLFDSSRVFLEQEWLHSDSKTYDPDRVMVFNSYKSEPS